MLEDQEIFPTRREIKLTSHSKLFSTYPDYPDSKMFCSRIWQGLAVFWFLPGCYVLNCGTRCLLWLKVVKNNSAMRRLLQSTVLGIALHRRELRALLIKKLKLSSGLSNPLSRSGHSTDLIRQHFLSVIGNGFITARSTRWECDT